MEDVRDRAGTGLRHVGRLAAGILLLAVTGCDYWPPALQTQIEQLKGDLQTLTAERGRLEQQIVTLSRAREDLQSQVDQLTRVNKERAAMIAELEHSLKAARATKAAAPAKATVKSSVKSQSKAARPTAAKKMTRPPVKKKSVATGTYSKTIR